MLNQTKDDAEQYANSYFESSEHEESTKTQNTQMEKEQYFYSSPSDEDELNTSNEIVEKDGISNRQVHPSFERSDNRCCH